MLLSDFPSGSSINYHNGKFYLIGDDANDILILDRDYQKADSIRLFDYPDKRIPKKKKVDFESSSLITLEGRDYLLVKGSASRKKRMKLMLISLDKEGESLEEFPYEEFAMRLNTNGIHEINIEGSTLIGNRLVLANRGNEVNPINHLVITESNFWQRQHEASISVSEVTLSITGPSFLGISELCYVESKDLLFLTFSSELTNNSYNDGLIGDSYLGWIDNASCKINVPNLQVNGMIDLTDVSEEFKGEKIEGICVERVEGEEYTLHLISDNDQGQSKLFKVRMTI